MHLHKISLQNFRSFKKTTVPLTADLTVLVGENNGGKSNVIDAIRLITMPLGGRREIYCEPTDIRFGAPERAFNIEAHFAGLTVPQQGRLISAAADASLENAVFGLTYDETGGRFPVRPNLWAGQQKGSPEPNCHEMVRHVYLPPLRDAKRALASGNPTRIYALLKHFLDDDDPDDLARRLSRTADEPILGRVDGAVEIGLTALTSGVRRQAAALCFASDEKLIDIARDLRFTLADHGIRPEDLRYSGHGYANLLYMATIAVELENVNNADLTLFLVEEPEAHLHPQLQAAVLCFLESQCEKVVPPDHQGPAGQVQVVVATHSPNLSAWVASKKLVFLKSIEEAEPVRADEQGPQAIAEAAPEVPVDAVEAVLDALPVLVAGDHQAEEADAAQPEGQGGAPEAVVRRESRCIPLAEIAIPEPDRRKIDRYLDVTKSAFLFGGRMLLVEGIAEALLFPVIAKKHVLRDRPDDMLLFRSTVFVPIDGVDFKPYARLLLTAHSDVRIADRLVIVTDGDRGELPLDETCPGQARKADLDALAGELGAAGVFEAITSTHSLESELVAAGNADLLKGVYLALHPRSEEKWNVAVGKAEAQRAVAIQGLFETTRKGDFAQLLADEIAADKPFIVPDYIRAAIESVVR